MFFISWSGVGILVPVIAFISFFITTPLFGANSTNLDFVGSLITTVALLLAGLFFRKINVRRNLYYIPMEYWSIVSGIFALMQIPHLLGMA